MLYNRKTEHQQNVIFAVKQRTATLAVSLLICGIAVYITNCFFDGKLFESLSNDHVKVAVAIIIAVIIICEIKSICSLYEYLDFESDLRELEMESTLQSLQTCIQMYRRFKSSIDTDKTLIDVLKSLSPIPLAVLLFGFLIDKNKTTSLNWNIYTVVMIAVILTYTVRLKHYLANYAILKRRLLDIQDTHDAIRKKVQERNLKACQNSNNEKPIFKSF